MLGLLLFFVVFLWFTIKIYRKKGLTPSFLLYALYTLSGFAAIVLVLFYDYGKNPYIEDYNGGVLFLLVALLLFLYPFMRINENNVKSLTLPTKNVLYSLIVVMTILSWFSILYFVPIARSMFFINITDIASVRNMVARGEHPFIVETIFNTIAGTAASFYVLQLLFSFLLLIEKKKITGFAMVVLLSSLSYPIFVLAYLGRDGVLFWFISFLSFVLLFRNYLSAVVLKKLKRIALVMSVPFILIFLIITVGRFVVGGDSDGVLYPILAYLGQGPINFAELYYTDVRYMEFGAHMFPLFFSSTNEVNYLLERYDIKTWVFKTFVSSIYMDFGAVLTLLISVSLIMLFIFFYRNDKLKCNLSFPTLILFSLFFTVYSQGVFYFRQYNRVGNLFIIVMILLAFVFTYLPKRKIVL